MSSFCTLTTRILLPLTLGGILLVSAGYPPTVQQGEGSFLAGNRLPDLTWQTTAGEEIALREQEGSALLIMFLDPAEKHDTDQLALIKPIVERHAEAGLKVITVCFPAEGDTTDVGAIFAEGGYEWPVVMLEDRQSFEQYGVDDLPKNAIVARNNRVLLMVGTVNRYNQQLLEGNILVALRSL